MDKKSLMALILGTALTGSVSANADQKSSAEDRGKDSKKCEQMKCGTGKCGSMKQENCDDKKYDNSGFQKPENNSSGGDEKKSPAK